jgi:hypothetical protein
MALPPHWLDDVIGNERDPVAIAKAIADNPTFAYAVRIGVKRGLLAKEPGQPDPDIPFNQWVRTAILQAIANPSGEPGRHSP